LRYVDVRPRFTNRWFISLQFLRSFMFVAKTNMPGGFYKPLGNSGIIGHRRITCAMEIFG
ncbi:MAG: hypothetical protein KGI06_02900, partial [Candidatus Micrarchaeota archaeon]|nr:hypothetical protein [Candidatus Micrarchaeota archaeon]